MTVSEAGKSAGVPVKTESLVKPGSNDQATRLLIVDDDPVFLKLISRVLGRDGYQIRCVERGSQVLDVFPHWCPDLLLMDLNIPDIGGLELADRLQDLETPLPFVVMTGHGDERIAVKMMKNGALDYLAKDAHFLELIPIVVRQSLERIFQNRALLEARTRLLDTASRLEKAQLIAGLASFEVSAVSGVCYHFSSSLAEMVEGFFEEGETKWEELIYHCVSSLDYVRVVKEFRAFLHSDRVLNVEFRIRNENSGMSFLQLTGHNIAFQEDRVLVIFRDISERKALQSEILQVSWEERQRIGQDIHDGLCQHLAGMDAMFSALISSSHIQNHPPSRNLVAEIRSLSRQATQMSRDLAHGLVAYEVDSDSWFEAIANMVEIINRQEKLSVDMHINESLRINDSRVCNAIFRITQEALTNARKHSDSNHISIRLWSEPHWLELIIEDDGKGVDTSVGIHSAGLGIHLMKYRAETAGGHLELTSSAGSGTKVHAKFPTG